MTWSLETPDQQEIWRILRSLNRAWVNGHPEQIANFLHPGVVFVSPDLQKRTQGREACVASYQEFCRQAAIRSFSESEPAIDVCGNTAVATYGFEIRYEMNQQDFHETGRDLFVFAREAGEWRAAWRTILGLN
jgi:hypothetical protein